MAQSFPYSDEYMRYDYATHRYVLTLKYVTDVLGVDMERRVASNKAINKTAIINMQLNTVSVQVYNYIYARTMQEQVLQWVIAVSPTAQKVIRDAMSQQLTYFLMFGDLSRSLQPDKRALYMDEQAKITLSETIPETGVPLTYQGTYYIKAPSYEQGGY